jgi:hypothetical protein
MFYVTFKSSGMCLSVSCVATAQDAAALVLGTKVTRTAGVGTLGGCFASVETGMQVHASDRNYPSKDVYPWESGMARGSIKERAGRLGVALFGKHAG